MNRNMVVRYFNYSLLIGSMSKTIKKSLKFQTFFGRLNSFGIIDCTIIFCLHLNLFAGIHIDVNLLVKKVHASYVMNRHVFTSYGTIAWFTFEVHDINFKVFKAENENPFLHFRTKLTAPWSMMLD